MHIDVQENDTHTLVIPRTKSIDASMAEEFKKKMEDIVNSRSSLIVLDMQDVNFIDSTALGLLIATYKNLNKDQNLIICNISEGIQGILKLTRLDKFFTLFSSKESAFKAFKIDD
ncbi:MAG: STAS domain-containing protein [Desulfonatronovibrio sp.]|nr:STAS domain-containing protein [Desulfovibrionales bacterium]